jgi:serine/threonine protein kinase
MSAQLQPGTEVQGRYRIIQLIGQGGMGAVYEAIDQRFNNKVALKQMFLDPNLTPKQKDIVEKAFEREAQILNTLRHTSLPRVSDHFSDPNGRFLVMDYIKGTDLATLLEQRMGTQGQPLTEQEVIPWAIQILRALEYLHQQSPPVIHRDIKPHNLTVTPQGEIFLLDFGISKGTSKLGNTIGASSGRAAGVAGD